MNSLAFERLQQEVQEGNQQLDLIFNSLPQSLALVTPDFEILRVNAHFLELYGVQKSDVLGRKCHKACFGSEIICEGCLVEQALISKKPEKRIKSFPSGEICEMTAQPVLNDEGEVTHVLDMRTNITELVEKEKELQRVEFAMNQSTDEFWLFDKNWKVTYASKSAAKNLGFAVHELKGAGIDKFNLLHRLENLSNLFEKLKKKKNIRMESVQFKRDGNTYPCEMNLSYFSDDDEYIYAVVRNISKRKKYENELIDSRESAERASMLKSTFLANMSHEIRTPMNAIIGFSNFILEEELDKETKAELKLEIKDNSSYLLNLISNIMEISQIESGNRKAETSQVNIQKLLEQIVKEHQEKCPEKIGFSYDIEIPADAKPLASDKNLIAQILERLLDNAFKFTSSGGVNLKVSYHKKSYTFAVSDTGIGISEGKFEEIFEPFLQLNSMIQGVGIGLTICQHQAKMLKSNIELKSVAGKGSVFSFTLKT